MTADGYGVMAIMREAGVSKTTVWRWQSYFAEAGVEGLIKGRSKPPGRKPLSAAIKLEVVEKTVKERPANATHWSVRSMAEEMGISHTSVQRIRRDTLTSGPQLKTAIENWIEHRKNNPKPFTWTKSAAKIVVSYRRPRKNLANIVDGCT